MQEGLIKGTLVRVQKTERWSDSYSENTQIIISRLWMTKAFC